MEIKGYFKDLKITPKKLRFFLPEIKKMTPVESLNYLYYAKQRPAQFFYKAIASVIASAKNTFKIDPNLLKFKLLTVEEGRGLKRYKPGGRGAAKPIRRDFSHIKIILEAKAPAKPKKEIEPVVKAEVKTEVKAPVAEKKKPVQKKVVKKKLVKVKSK